MFSNGVKGHFAITLAVLAIMLRTFKFLGSFLSKEATSSTSHTATAIAHPIVIDLTVCISSPTDPPSTYDLDPHKWHRVEKDLYLYTLSRQSAWLYIQLANEKELGAEDLLVMDIRVGIAPPPNPSSD
jgi:hypothetical protein